MGNATNSALAPEQATAPGAEASAPAVGATPEGPTTTVAGSLNPNRQARGPFTGWRKQSNTPPIVHEKVVNDDVVATVTDEELTTFYKAHGQILRGVKQKQQLDALLASKERPELALTGWSNGPVFSGRTETLTEPIT